MEWICGNGVAKIGGKKNLLQLVCGNDIAEIEEGKKRVAIDLKKKKKNWFMAMALPQLPQIPPISAMTWPQTNCDKKKIFPPISAMPLP